jgi:hypothetical protein
MAAINPGKRLSISSAAGGVVHLDASAFAPDQARLPEALKCWERVDLGMAFSLTFRKFEQFARTFGARDIGKDGHTHRVGERVEDGLRP